MNGFNEQELEKLLRNSLRPQSPRGLKEQLVSQARSSGKPKPSATVARPEEGWLRRWWPIWASAAVSLICAMVMAIQQKEIRELKQAIQSPVTNATATRAATEPKPANGADSPGGVSPEQQKEIERLKDEAAKLSGEISQAEQMRNENKQLRAQLAVPVPGAFTSEELDAMEKARERAMQIRCANNMKQMGLAVRVWAGDNNDVFPPDLVSMSNELSTPKILVCPADTNRPVAANFGSYTDGNCSYEYLAVGVSNAEPDRVLFRCAIHGNIGLCDGSVQIGVGKTHPEWLQERDGKLYFEPPHQ